MRAAGPAGMHVLMAFQAEFIIHQHFGGNMLSRGGPGKRRGIWPRVRNVGDAGGRAANPA